MMTIHINTLIELLEAMQKGNALTNFGAYRDGYGDAVTKVAMFVKEYATQLGKEIAEHYKEV